MAAEFSNEWDKGAVDGACAKLNGGYIKLYTTAIADAILEGKAQSSTATSKDEFVEVVEEESAGDDTEAAAE